VSKAKNIKITEEEMDYLNEPKANIVQLVSGGYHAALGIQHELHCLDNFRILFNWDYYHVQYEGKHFPWGFKTAHQSTLNPITTP
jgi:hypothetical protein